jgi:epoxyqueuosine reductase
VKLPPIPRELLTVPGIWRDQEAATKAFEREPLQDFAQLHFDAAVWAVRSQWRSIVPVAPRLSRAVVKAERAGQRQPEANGTRSDVNTGALTVEVKDYAAAIGLSAVGVAQYDPKYTFAPFQGKEVGDRVIVCILEQNWAMTQRIPSARSEQTALSTYAEVLGLAARLADFLHEKGYRAQPHDLQGHAVVIHYGVEAGLGQLGLNGQLLTRAAGSRCRITLVGTNAPLVLDHPVDYGVHAICDACQACVERCPSGAIPATRRMHRGVRKAKINTARCLPVVAQATGCAVCMKVCPVQRYGLDAVLEEHDRSGKILGKGTDELEGYDWPLDGRHYAPGERPALERSFFNPPGTNFDFTRKIPLTSDRTLI